MHILADGLPAGAPLFLPVFVVCGWGGWGGVGHANVLVSCAHVGCYAVHVRVILRMHAWWMLRSARVFLSLHTW